MSSFAKFRWYFGITVLALMIPTSAYLKIKATSFRQGTGTIAGKELKLNIASTPQARAKGLSGRATLERNQGMLFLFTAPGVYGFWMKDMKFPIDIIWLNDRKVVDLTPNVPVPVKGQPLESYVPLKPVNAVL